MKSLTQPVLSTMEVDGSRRWLRPKLSAGVWWRRRRAVAGSLVVIYGALPWVRVGGNPALLLDIAHGRFYLAGIAFQATDTLLLMLFLLTCFFGVFMLTALFGRAWCGWGCPQTVYMEFVFRPIDRWMRRSRRPWRRVAGALAYGAMATAMAHTFLAYFVGTDTLWRWLHQSPTHHPGPFLVCAATTVLVLFDFGYFREQMCTVACPYARLQSALLDNRSLTVGYDAARGEPRGKLAKQRESQATQGDCIACNACVVTCPTGIDIRDGLQMECIACTQCIDACDAIMERVGKPKGLIRYIARDAAKANVAAGWLRPRTVFYGAIIIGLMVALTVAVSTRRDVDITILRAAGAPYIQQDDGTIQNRLRVRLSNATGRDLHIGITIPNGKDLRWVVSDAHLLLPAHGHAEAFVFILAPPASFTHGVRDIQLSIEATGQSWRENYRLLGPNSEEKKAP